MDQECVMRDNSQVVQWPMGAQVCFRDILVQDSKVLISKLWNVSNFYYTDENKQFGKIKFLKFYKNFCILAIVLEFFYLKITNANDFYFWYF